jgi:hypothetical protein
VVVKLDFDGVGFEEVPPTTRCKHGAGSCEKCGTTNERERVHTTRGGKGVVGRLTR